MNEIKFERIYDLSEPIGNNMQEHPAIEYAGTRSKVLMEMVASHIPSMGGAVAPGWPIWCNVELTTHTGTHIDGPWHFNKYGRRIDEFPIETFLGKGVVLDFRHLKPKEAIKAEDLEKAKPEIEEGDILIINTGYHKKYGTKEYVMDHPGYDGESVGPFCVKKKIKMLGSDTVCPEPGSEEEHWDHPLHRICLIENEIPLIEHLGGDIDKVTGKRCYIIALPLKLIADSANARIIALV